MKASHQVPKARPARRKLARRLLALVLTLGAVPALAQHGRHHRAAPTPTQAPPLPTSAADTVQQVVDLPPATIDSLAVEPLTEPAVDSARLAWLQTPATLYELVGDRMGCIETQAPHQFNEAVLAYVRLFTERQRGYTQHVLEREQFYFPIFEKYLTQYNLPTDLKYLSVVESALIPTAKSPVGAVGLWQFMPPTASDLRLKRDEWVDERMNPEKATEAACKHLRYLYGVFHDWELVLAAYNWGAGNVQRVIRKTGKHSFWELYAHMPAETRNYVPTFTAIMYAMKYAPEHGLNDASLRYQHYEPLDTLGVRGQAFDLRRLSRALGYADSLALNRYNPEVRRGGLPTGYRPYVLRYPSADREHLGDVDRATLLAYCQPTNDLPQMMAMRGPALDSLTPWPMRNALASGPHASPEPATPHYRRLYYTVRRGQTVAAVAEKFDVSPSQLRRWNELRKDQALKPGRELLVLQPLPASAATPAAPPVLAAAPHRQATAADSATQALVAANQRYARLAQAAAAREASQAQALLRAQKQQAARLAAEQRQAIFRAAALAHAAEQQATKERNELAASEAVSDGDAPADSLAAGTASLQPRQRETPLVATRPRDIRREEVTPKPLPQPEVVAERTATRADRTRVTKATELGAAARPKAISLKTNTLIVQKGDTLYNISRRFKVSVEELRQLNHLASDKVEMGQKLVVPQG